MSKCNHQPTTETHPRKGEVWRCVVCGVVSYNGPSEAKCGGKRAEPRRSDRVEFPVCHDRGEQVTLLTNCGCGQREPIAVHLCPVYGLCTPITIVEWRKIPGAKKRPQACSLCLVRHE